MTRVTMKMTTLRKVSSECLQQSPIDRIRHISPAALDVVEQHWADAEDMRQPLLGQMALVYPQLPERPARRQRSAASTSTMPRPPQKSQARIVSRQPLGPQSTAR